MNFKLCDTRGFDDPNMKNHILWRQLLREMCDKSVDITKQGIGAIIIPVMVPLSLRIEASSTNLVFEALQSLTLTNRFRPLNHQQAKYMPKIIIVFNNLKPDETLAAEDE